MKVNVCRIIHGDVEGKKRGKGKNKQSLAMKRENSVVEKKKERENNNLATTHPSVTGQTPIGVTGIIVPTVGTILSMNHRRPTGFQPEHLRPPGCLTSVPSQLPARTSY